MCTTVTYLDVAARVETVHLVQQLKHSALDLTLATRGAVIALRADRVDLVCGGRIHTPVSARLPSDSQPSRTNEDD